MAKHNPESDNHKSKAHKEKEAEQAKTETDPNAEANEQFAKEAEKDAESDPNTEISDEQARAAAENMREVYRGTAQHEKDQADQNAREIMRIAMVRSVAETDGKVLITTKEEGKEDHTQELGPSQAEAFNRYKNIEWENEGEADAAKAITLYSFGIGDKEAFEKEVHDMSDDEREAFFKIAKKLDLGVVTKKHFKKEEE